MKKHLRYLKPSIVAVLLLFLLPTLCSCAMAINSPKIIGNLPYKVQDKIVNSKSDPVAKAELIYGLGMNNLDRSESYTYEEELSIKLKKDSHNELKQTTTVVQQAVYDGKKLSVHFDSRNDYTVKSPENTFGDITKHIEGYRDGKMYISNTNTKSGMYSEISQNDYIEHLNSRVELHNGVFDCEKAEFTKTEDGFTVITLSDYSRAELERQEEMLNDYAEYAPDYLLTDITVTLKVDEYYWIYEIVTELSFKCIGEASMKWKVTGKYSMVNLTEIADIDFTEYNKVDDLRPGYSLSEISEATTKAEKGELTHNVIFTENGNTKKYNTVIGFTNTERDLKYYITDGDGKYQYENGALKIYDKNNKYVDAVALNRKEALPLLISYFTPISFSYYEVSDFKYEKNGDTETYTLTLLQKVRDSLIYSYSGYVVYNIDTVETDIIITVKDGVFTKFDYSIEAEYNGKKATLTGTVQYTNMEYPSESEE